MDDTEYRKKLSEVADWAIPKLTQTDINESKKRIRGRGRPTNEEQYQDAHEEIFLDIYQGINPTHPPEVLKVKNQATICDDCGCVCDQGRRKESKIYENKGRRYWKEHCITCDKHKDPYTGQFNLNGTQASVKWNSFCKEVKGTYKSLGSEAREVEVIRYNPEDPHKI